MVGHGGIPFMVSGGGWGKLFMVSDGGIPCIIGGGGGGQPYMISGRWWG